jgi:hypothetical protein
VGRHEASEPASDRRPTGQVLPVRGNLGAIFHRGVGRFLTQRGQESG